MRRVLAVVAVGVFVLSACTIEVAEPEAAEESTSAAVEESESTEESSEPETEEPTFAEWVDAEGRAAYVPFTEEFADLADDLSKAANLSDINGVAAACAALGRKGKAGLSLPESPDAGFNNAWDTAMRAYADAGTYAPLIRAYSAAGVTGCAEALQKGNKQVGVATRILVAEQ